MMQTEKVKAYKVTFIVDEDAFGYLAKSHGYTEGDELWLWEDTEEIEYERPMPCEDCGSRSMMEEYACTTNEGFCTDCCMCEEHWGDSED